MRGHHNIAVICVPPSRAGYVMAQCQDTIKRGIDIGDMGDAGDVVERIEQDNLQLWLVLDGDEPVATCFTDINVEAGGRRFIGVYGLAGTRIMRWAGRLSGALLAFAKEERCDRVMFRGRPGWSRVLPEYQPVRRMGGELIWQRWVLQ